MKKYLGLYLLLIFIALVACEDDFGVKGPELSDKIGFELDLNNVSPTETGRSCDSLQRSSVNITLLNEKLRGDSLFLFTIVDDSIPSDIKGDKIEANKAQSRGIEIHEGNISDMGVAAIVYTGDEYTDWGSDASNAKMYMYNEQSTKSSSWSTNRNWPETENTRMRFFAYSPYTDNFFKTTTAVTQMFDYTISDEITEQTDLLVASSDVKCPNDYKPADITFAHALTAVKFEVANTVKNLVVKAIRVKGVYNKGTYTYDYCGVNKDDNDDTTPNSDLGTWDVVETDDKKTYEITSLNKQIVGGTAKNVPLNEGEYVMMLMPQTLPAGATVEIDVTDNVLNRDVTLKASIAGNVWGKGKQVTYCISASDEIVQYVFETSDVQIPEYYGGEGSFKVKSYKKTTRFDGERIDPVVWTIDDVIDDERNKTAVWMKELKGYEGVGVSNESDWETINYKMGPAPLKLATSHWQKGRSHSNYHIALCDEKGSYANPYDLSTKGGTSTMNTANCYIVGSAGHFMFPVVYGNAIGGGACNGHDYVDHNDVAWFTDTNDENKWIGNRYNIKEAYLVWQDAPGLISDLRIIGDGAHKYVGFEVRKEYACDGNAVIAVKDENDILWSWHIWVSHYQSLWEGNNNGCTDIQNKEIHNKKYGLLNESGKLIIGSTTVDDPFNRDGTHGSGANEVDKNHGGQAFTLLSKYIGYCRGEEKYYGGSATINFKQNSNDFNLKVESKMEHISTANNACYYQFGRKDPIVGYGETVDGGVSFVDKTRFDNDGMPITTLKYKNEPASSIGETIKNPDVFYGANSLYWLSPQAVNNKGTLIRPQFLWQASGYGIPGDGTNSSNRWNDIDFWTTSTPISKTMYDPCPMGYEMPRSDAFTGFLLDTKNPDKQITGRPEEYRAYFYNGTTDNPSSESYTYVMKLSKDVEDVESNNNGNILREPNPCAFVSGYGEFGYWFRPDVNGAGKYNGAKDLFGNGSNLESEQQTIYDSCILLMALGCRGGDNASNGSVREYRNMGNALTATLVKMSIGTGEIGRPSRLYFFHKTTNVNSFIGAPIGWYPDGHYENCRGHKDGNWIYGEWQSQGFVGSQVAESERENHATTFSSNNQIKTVATSPFSLGFTIIPAKSGKNGVDIQ